MRTHTNQPDREIKSDTKGGRRGGRGKERERGGLPGGGGGGVLKDTDMPLVLGRRLLVLKKNMSLPIITSSHIYSCHIVVVVFSCSWVCPQLLSTPPFITHIASVFLFRFLNIISTPLLACRIKLSAQTLALLGTP